MLYMHYATLLMSSFDIDNEMLVLVTEANSLLGQG